MVHTCFHRYSIISGLDQNQYIAAAIMHGTLNGTAGLALLVVKGGNRSSTVGVTGICRFYRFLIVNLFV